MKDPDSKFYLSINRNYGKTSDVWYSSQPMGKNTLGTLAKTMSDKAGFTARHTNHSGRKTSITNLLDAEVPANEVAQLSGHKNIMSLNHYNTVSLEKQIKMSSVLHAKTSGSEKIHSDHPGPSTSNTDSDDELFVASQELEVAMKTIQNYEHNSSASNSITNINQPALNISTSEGFNQFPFPNQTPIFSNCIFSCPVNIVFKH